MADVSDGSTKISVSINELFGTGIQSVEQTQTSEESGGTNEITVTLTNGVSSQFYVKNGENGENGTPGRDGEGLTPEAINALLMIAQKVAYVDPNGSTYYQALYDAFFPPADLVSIDAVFTQGGAEIYESDPLDSLKTYLVVTANYDDGTSGDVTALCTLSGTLTVGTSTITATYKDMSDTFDVVVSAESNYMYNWDFTKSLTDSVQGVTATLAAQAGDSPTRDGSGVHVTTSSGYIDLGEIFESEISIEVDFGEMDWKGNNNGRLLMIGAKASGGLGTGFMWRSNGTWNWYVAGSWDTAISGLTDPEMFANSTLKAVFDASGHMAVYKDGTLLGTSTRTFLESAGKYIEIGAYSGSGGYSCYFDMTVKAVRIWKEEE